MPRISPTLLALAGIFALGGCTLPGPPKGVGERQPTLAAPSGWSNPSELASPAVRDEAALASWWKQLGDPGLEALIVQAQASAPDLRSAQARLRQARAARDLAQAGLFPTLGASTSASRSRNNSSATFATSSATTLYKAGFDASWEPDVFGAARRGIEGAEADVQSRQATVEATRVSLAAEVALNYVELRTYQRRLAIARDNLASQAETLEITRWRNQAGLASSLDVEQARTILEQTRSSIPGLETGRAQAEHRLAILLGQPPGSLKGSLAETQPLPAAPDRIAVGIPADTLRHRPDVQAAERTLAGETARLDQQLATRYPSFSLSGFFGWQSFSLGGMGTSANIARSVTGSLAATLFDAGRIRSRIAAQDAVQEQALVAYEQSILTALEDVENALVAYAAGREREAARREAADAARNAALLARNLYQSGLADFQKVLDTERTRLTAEDSLATAQSDVLTAVIQLYKALGGGWNSTQVNPEDKSS